MQGEGHQGGRVGRRGESGLGHRRRDTLECHLVTACDWLLIGTRSSHLEIATDTNSKFVGSGITYLGIGEKLGLGLLGRRLRHTITGVGHLHWLQGLGGRIGVVDQGWLLLRGAGGILGGLLLWSDSALLLGGSHHVDWLGRWGHHSGRV